MENMEMKELQFKDVYKGKRVLITGNTGFKGSWLTTWLLNLGAEVYGYSLDVPTEPSLFSAAKLESKIIQCYGDVRNKVDLQDFILATKPEFIFHLAAQAIVSESYNNPLDTISTNVFGTAVLLDVIKEIDFQCNCIIITSDKAYENVEWIWGYRENDRLGGKDIYSGSKGAAELIIHSYWESFIKYKPNIKISTVRAGNVIGGGDWSADRIVVDCILSLVQNRSIELRSPSATRPWQHVLEPLSGYLRVGQMLDENEIVNGDAFNFGPSSNQNRTVLELARCLEQKWGKVDESKIRVLDNIPFDEAKLLKLNCDKALALLKWQAILQFQDIIDFIIDWYKAYYSSESMFEITSNQIELYTQKAIEQELQWTKN